MTIKPQGPLKAVGSAEISSIQEAEGLQVVARQRTLRRLLIAAGVLGVVVVLYLGVCAFILSAVLTPIRKDGPGPIESGLSAETIDFQSDVDQIPLKGWLLPSSGDRAIVLVHGVNSYSWDAAQPEIAQAYVEAGFHVLIFDLRGHGRSGGDRLGLGWLERRDVRAAVDLLLSRGFSPGRIGVHSGSYGAATAILSTAVIPGVGALVSDSAFADVREVMDTEIQRKIGIPPLFSRFFLRPGIALVARVVYSLDLTAITPERAVQHIAPRPILFIHGSEDLRIRVENTYRLKAASGNPNAELWILKGYGHTEGVWIGEGREEVSPLREAYLRKITEFFDQSLP